VKELAKYLKENAKIPYEIPKKEAAAAGKDEL
jgi:hypothetical protein